MTTTTFSSRLSAKDASFRPMFSLQSSMQPVRGWPSCAITRYFGSDNQVHKLTCMHRSQFLGHVHINCKTSTRYATSHFGAAIEQSRVFSPPCYNIHMHAFLWGITEPIAWQRFPATRGTWGGKNRLHVCTEYVIWLALLFFKHMLLLCFYAASNA